MGRPRMAVGTFGAISRTQTGPTTWKARTRYRDFSGTTRYVAAAGRTAAAAERSLRLELLKRAAAAPTNGDITADTLLSVLMNTWLEQIGEDNRRMPQTVFQYCHHSEKLIVPALGDLKLREVTVGAADRFLRGLAREHPAQAKMCKTVLGQAMNLAERHGAIQRNPVDAVKHLRTSENEVRALNPRQAEELRRIVRDWRGTDAVTGRRPRGPKPTSLLADLVEVMLGTGLRPGECLALRWCDIDLSGAKATLTVAGTIVYLKGKGYFRQPKPKSRSGFRTVTLPAFAAGVLLRRQIEGKPNDLDAVFPSRAGTWISDANARTALRKALAGTDFADWVTPRTFRKTVATVIDKEADAKTAAQQLGHSRETTTTRYYVEKSRVAPDVSELIERRLGPQEPLSGA